MTGNKSKSFLCNWGNLEATNPTDVLEKKKKMVSHVGEGYFSDIFGEFFVPFS